VEYHSKDQSCRCANAPARIMLQLGALERGGYIRLDEVWSAPTKEELAEVYLVANQMMLDVLEGHSEKF
jgi:hypothetical protein